MGYRQRSRVCETTTAAAALQLQKQHCSPASPEASLSHDVIGRHDFMLGMIVLLYAADSLFICCFFSLSDDFSLSVKLYLHLFSISFTHLFIWTCACKDHPCCGLAPWRLINLWNSYFKPSLHYNLADLLASCGFTGIFFFLPSTGIRYQSGICATALPSKHTIFACFFIPQPASFFYFFALLLF